MKKYKVNGISVTASSMADAIHQVKDGGSYSAVRVTIKSAADISLSKIVQIIKKAIEDYQDKVIKIANGKVYDYAKQAYMEMEFQVYMHDGFKDRDTWGSIPIDFRLDYSTIDKLMKESDYALEKTMSEIKKKLKSYENKTIYEDKTYRTDSLDSVNDSAASDILREIKSKYPQVKVRQIAKQRDGYHHTMLIFSNYPGEDATGFGNDPRTKERDNWTKFLKYLYKKYTGDNDDIGIYYDKLDILDFPNDSVDDSIKDEIPKKLKEHMCRELEYCSRRLKESHDKYDLMEVAKLLEQTLNVVKFDMTRDSIKDAVREIEIDAPDWSRVQSDARDYNVKVRKVGSRPQGMIEVQVSGSAKDIKDFVEDMDFEFLDDSIDDSIHDSITREQAIYHAESVVDRLKAHDDIPARIHNKVVYNALNNGFKDE